MKNAPCYQCRFRHPGCQTELCPYGYPAWKAVHDAEREAARATADADSHTIETMAKNSKRARTTRRVGQR